MKVNDILDELCDEFNLELMFGSVIYNIKQQKKD